MYANKYVKETIEVYMTVDEQRTFKKAMELAWKIGRDEGFENMPEEIQQLIDNIANNIEELLDYIPDEH